ncbi:MAG: class I SAM-dependent methyltransferase [Anaerolineae bacterium]|nr:class I SAM-dependent methyltransferase [Anaerolineae bacterium]
MNIIDSYNAVAADYVNHVAGELAHKPFDRALLRQFIELTQGGQICDVGCGPGHITRFLRDSGANVFGCDVSPAMIEQAQLLNPDLEFWLGDMRSLHLDDASLNGIVAFYSLVHTPHHELIDTLKQLKRVLKPQGYLLASFHLQDQRWQDNHLTEWWGRPVNVTFYFYTRDELEQSFIEAGFWLEQVSTRAPYPNVEVETQRAYLLAQVP